MVGGQIEGWHPVHDNHAIEVMAVVVTFLQPIPDLLFKRILRASEDVAFEAGLKSRHSISAVQIINANPIELGPGGFQSSPAGGIQGRMFNAIVEPSDGAAISSQLAEQLQVHPNMVVYRTWRYVSWKWQVTRMRTLLAPVLEGIADSVACASLRLEYLDRFRFDGSAADAEIKGLLRTDSPLIAPYVFSATDLWHSHTGAFISSNGQSKRLQQVMVNSLDEPQQLLPGTIPIRWINITTALEDRFLQLSDESEEIRPNSIFQNLESMHTLLKDVLASVITKKMVERIYLRGT